MANLSGALQQLRIQREQAARVVARIEAAIHALGGGKTKSSSRRRGARKMSAAARKRIAAAQKARWAKLRANQAEE